MAGRGGVKRPLPALEAACLYATLGDAALFEVRFNLPCPLPYKLLCKEHVHLEMRAVLYGQDTVETLILGESILVARVLPHGAGSGRYECCACAGKRRPKRWRSHLYP